MKIIKKSNQHEVVDGWFEQERMSPDFTNLYKNSKNPKETFFQIRKYILDTIPNDTKWYYVEFDEADYDLLQVINSPGWDHCPSRKLKECSAFRYEKEAQKFKKLNEVLTEVPSLNQKQRELICLTKDLKNGPYTIIEGNHRAIALAKYHMDTGKNLLNSGFIGVISNKSKTPFL